MSCLHWVDTQQTVSFIRRDRHVAKIFSYYRLAVNCPVNIDRGITFYYRTNCGYGIPWIDSSFGNFERTYLWRNWRPEEKQISISYASDICYWNSSTRGHSLGDDSSVWKDFRVHWDLVSEVPLTISVAEWLVAPALFDAVQVYSPACLAFTGSILSKLFFLFVEIVISG